jgi:hypothetical protein
MTWVLWKDASNPRGLTKQEFEDRMVPSSKITCMTDFQRLWTELEELEKSGPTSTFFNLRLFKDGFTPTWEDSARGGKWVVLAPKQTAMKWFLKVGMAMVSGNFFRGEYAMTGAVLSARPRPKDVVSIWCNVQMSDAEIRTVKEQLCDLLGPGASVDFLRIEARVALNQKERTILDSGSSLPSTPMSPYTPTTRKHSKQRGEPVVRNLFGKPRDRALSDTDALFAPRPRATRGTYSGGSTSSNADEGFNWENSRARQARRQADLEELRALVPSPPKTGDQYSPEYKAATRRFSDSEALGDETAEGRARNARGGRRSGHTRRGTRSTQRRKDSGDDDNADASRDDEVITTSDAATQATPRPSASTALVTEKNSRGMAMAGGVAMMAAAALTILAGWLHLASPALAHN